MTITTSTPRSPSYIKVDTDKHDSLFELETLERNLDSMERAMDIKKHWCIKDRAHMKNMLSSARATDEAFHLETDDGSFQTTRFRGKVGDKGHGRRRGRDRSVLC